MSETSAPAAPVKRRRSTPKAIKDIRAIISELDALILKLVDRPEKQVPLVTEKSGLIQKLISLESEADENEQDEQLVRMTEQHTADVARISELERQTQSWKQIAKTPEIVTVPDADHASVRQERDTLKDALSLLATILNEISEDAQRLELAVRFVQSCRDAGIARQFCNAVRVSYDSLSDCLTKSQADLVRWRGVKDPEIVALVGVVERVKFPPPVKVEAAPVIRVRTGPDTRTQEQRDADSRLAVEDARRMMTEAGWR